MWTYHSLKDRVEMEDCEKALRLRQQIQNTFELSWFSLKKQYE